VLPVWAEGLLLLAAILFGASFFRLRKRAKKLAARLEAREREGHFLGESPDPQVIVRHAHAAASAILPLSRFDLYRVDDAGRVHEVWTLPAPGEGLPREPTRDDAHAYLGIEVDPARILEFAATETDRSFAPRELLSGGPATRQLRLPLYSGDRFVAFLDLASPEPIDDLKKGEIRGLLGPLTASLHAAHNWTISVTDELSGLASRRYFETRLAEEWARHARYENALALACFDLDHFKTLNDTHGHAAGDLALRKFGELTRSAIRASDVACRYGGEEFAVLFPETDSTASCRVAERIRMALENERFRFDGRPFYVTVSAGVADSRRPATAAGKEQLVFRADQALYMAKAKGRNRVIVWSEAAARETAGARRAKR
jgi:diguanylate cyclase (GGDEF)-like protein